MRNCSEEIFYIAEIERLFDNGFMMDLMTALGHNEINKTYLFLILSMLVKDEQNYSFSHLITGWWVCQLCTCHRLTRKNKRKFCSYEAVIFQYSKKRSFLNELIFIET